MKTKQIDFSKFSSMKLGRVLDVKIIENTSKIDKNNYLIGSCNNILMGNNPPPLMMLGKKYDYIKVEDGVLKVGGATPSGKIVSYCKKHNLGGFEFLSHLPGKLGGLVKMNAGLKEFEIFDYLISISTSQGDIKKDEVDYGYRFTNIFSPILEVSFEMLYGFDKNKIEIFKKMRSTQPNIPSAGSCFKNPIGDYAGRLIEAVGLKGFRVGAMEFSQEHANFLVNHGGGTFEDAIFLIKEAQKRVYDKFKINLECEIVILDKNFTL